MLVARISLLTALIVSTASTRASWEPGPEHSEGTVDSVKEYKDAVVFHVRGSGYYESGRVVTNGLFGYRLGRPTEHPISPGDVIRVTADSVADGPIRMATEVDVIADATTGGVVIVEATLAEASAAGRRRWALNQYRSVAAVILPPVFAVLMGVGLTFRFALAGFVGWDRRFFPRHARVYLLVAVVLLPILGFIAWRLYEYTYYMVNYGLA